MLDVDAPLPGFQESHDLSRKKLRLMPRGRAWRAGIIRFADIPGAARFFHRNALVDAGGGSILGASPGQGDFYVLVR
jgi:hypothetical protein